MKTSPWVAQRATGQFAAKVDPDFRLGDSVPADRGIVKNAAGQTGRTGTPCSFCDSPEHEFKCCPQTESAAHEWWHADGVTRHLVCLACGAGLHSVEPHYYDHQSGMPPKACLRTSHRA